VTQIQPTAFATLTGKALYRQIILFCIGCEQAGLTFSGFVLSDQQALRRTQVRQDKHSSMHLDAMLALNKTTRLIAVDTLRRLRS
jgi:hypothetical protein